MTCLKSKSKSGVEQGTEPRSFSKCGTGGILLGSQVQALRSPRQEHHIIVWINSLSSWVIYKWLNYQTIILAMHNMPSIYPDTTDKHQPLVDWLQGCSSPGPQTRSRPWSHVIHCTGPKVWQRGSDGSVNLLSPAAQTPDLWGVPSAG